MSVLLLLIAAAGSAQEQPASAAQQLLPQRENALKNALRNLLTDRTKLAQPSVKPMNVVPGQATCGYIRVFPVRPDVDPGIVIPESGSDAKDRSRSGMPVYQGLPPCDLPPR